MFENARAGSHQDPAGLLAGGNFSRARVETIGELMQHGRLVPRRVNGGGSTGICPFEKDGIKRCTPDIVTRRGSKIENRGRFAGSEP